MLDVGVQNAQDAICTRLRSTAKRGCAGGLCRGQQPLKVGQDCLKIEIPSDSSMHVEGHASA